MKFQFPKIKFPWSKPSGREVLEEIFSHFTAEEIAILDSENAYIPHMYSLMMSRADYYHTRRTMDDVKRVAARHIYPLKERLTEQKAQKKLFTVVYGGIFSRGEYIY